MKLLIYILGYPTTIERIVAHKKNVLNSQNFKFLSFFLDIKLDSVFSLKIFVCSVHVLKKQKYYQLLFEKIK